LNNTQTFSYDLLNRVTGTSAPGISETGAATTITTSATYNWAGQPLTQTDGRGKTTTFEYDGRGNHVKTIDPLSGVRYRVYDRAGRLVAEVSPENYNAGLPLSNMRRTEYV
jgi:YD repeat-containing protein